MPKMGEKSVSSGCELRGEPKQQPDRQTDHIGELAVDPRDQRRAQSLHRVAPGPPLPLAAGEISVDQLRRELPEGDAAHLDTRPDLELTVDPVGTEERQRTEHLMGPAGKRFEAPTGLALESRLAQGASVDDDLGVP